VKTFQAAEDKTPMDGRFYAQGDVVRRAPLRKAQGDGRSSIMMGYSVCRADQFLKGGAELLAEILNECLDKGIIDGGQPKVAESRADFEEWVDANAPKGGAA
jgi:hypothetical protein